MDKRSSQSDKRSSSFHTEGYGKRAIYLSHEKGNYIRTDGRGIESFDEIKTFRKFMLNARFGIDFYYRISARTKLMLRPQYKANLNSVFNDSYGITQKYNSTGVQFGISYMLN